MTSKKTRNFEKALPEGYRQALYINTKSAKFGLIFNAIALLVLLLVMAFAVLTLYIGGTDGSDIFDVGSTQMLSTYLIFLGAMLGYVVLHELVHGIAYKAMTGEKLTFGMSWSCAFCGVPHIFTYRKTALTSVVMPFAVFTLLFIPILILFYFVHPLYYLLASFLFGLHLGGCSGDLYVLCLLTVKFKDPNTLMRDTGPEQFFYIPSEEKTGN
ncbi:MAG: DUF3267 domain-containing protein [Clostridia bacterium]|nr:DUF3267 domain-containing protein [Clostridia bacterium]